MGRNRGIAFKFAVLAAGLVVLCTVLWGTWTWQREKALLESRLEQKGRILVTAMAIPFINALLYEDMGIVEEGGLLDTFVSDIMTQTDLQPLYSMVLDPKGQVLAHNRFDEYGAVYDDPVTLKSLAAKGFLKQTVLGAGGKPYWDLAYPLSIHGKHWGVLRVGISLNTLDSELAGLLRELVVFSFLFFISGTTLFALIGRALGAPLKRLSQSMRGVGKELPPPLPKSNRRDEIGDLERSYAAMLEGLRRSESQRKKALRTLLDNERLVAVGQIVAGVAHEVNNPLSAMEGALYLLERYTPGKAERYLTILHEGIQRITRLVGELLDLSRSGEIELRPVTALELCERAAHFAMLAVKNRGTVLHVKPSCADATLRVDPDKIQQALLNLILNAADAAGSGGQVRLSCKAESEWVSILVEDDGPGVPSDLRERIFEPFFTTKPGGRGSGMGLAISRRIAEVHGGTLTVEEAPSGGACFILRLPITN